MPLRKLSPSRKIGVHRFALLADYAFNKRDAQVEATKLRISGKVVRILKMKTGWFVYYYPQ